MKQIIYFLLGVVFLSCNASKNLVGTTYKYKSKNRILELIFVDSKICKLKNTFNCSELPLEIKEITIISTYEKREDTIFLRNVDCNNKDCNKPLAISIPPQENTDCLFLHAASRKLGTNSGPNYATQFETYGLIPNIDIDTLYMIGKRLMLYKKDSLGNIGFIFK